MIVKVLGTGCTKCNNLEKQLIELKNDYQLNFTIEKVTQLNDIMDYGVLMTPGLVINDKVKCSGKIPDNKQILEWIKENSNA